MVYNALDSVEEVWVGALARVTVLCSSARLTLYSPPRGKINWVPASYQGNLTKMLGISDSSNRKRPEKETKSNEENKNAA